ncbi:hypothetical protein [Agrobacterium cavarae]|uniref:hypothetical protein n=1 Tax=Agrobacterium cavarae TaxID=2528239 RepID=UPI003D016B7D
MNDPTTPEADKLGTLIINLDRSAEARGRKYAALGQLLSFGAVFLTIAFIGWAANHADGQIPADDKINQENINVARR